ncbi:pyruvate kinase [Nocardioides sp. YIM 152588]|uniref:pyruvate kinase n=1 Tax=Nocardioides sp. YIM 152588 TaxID=3158259 RepID=UPI0032E4A5C6
MQDVGSLAAQVDELTRALTKAEEANAPVIERCHPRHRAGAVNLVHYAELRRHDLRDLQGDLTDIGVTSLATAEANVRAKLAAARSALGALDGEPGPWDLAGINDAIDAGDELLWEHADALLGPPPRGRAARIMVTLPSEAADDPALVRDLVHRGMDLARINCAHDGPDEWAAMARHVRAAARATGRPVRVYMDLGGPKLRTGPIAPGPAVVRVRPERDDLGRPTRPGHLWLTAGTDAGTDASTDPDTAPGPDARPLAGAPADAVPVPVDPSWLARLAVGDLIDFEDTRERQRDYDVVEVGDGWAVAAGDRTSYLVPGMTLRVDDDVTTVGPLPRAERRIRLAADDLLILTRALTPADPLATPPRIGCTLPEVFGAVRLGHRILFDDGEITGVVERVGEDEIGVRITRTPPGGKRLGAEKGINLPDTDLPVTALTEADLDALPTVVEHADVVGLSFVRSAADVAHVRRELTVRGGEHLGLVLKIETVQGFAHLPEILLDGLRWPRLGVMIARGDLMTEIGWERMSEVPHQIMSLCDAAHVPVIWATQVLESLAKRGVPSRAEMVDAAEAQRAECVMLNKGPYILDAITTLDSVLHRMGRVQRKSHRLLRRIGSWSD